MSHFSCPGFLRQLLDFLGPPACDYRNVFLVTVVTRKSMVILGTVVTVEALEVLAAMVMSLIKLFLMYAWVFVESAC